MQAIAQGIVEVAEGDIPGYVYRIVTAHAAASQFCTSLMAIIARIEQASTTVYRFPAIASNLQPTRDAPTIRPQSQHTDRQESLYERLLLPASRTHDPKFYGYTK